MNKNQIFKKFLQNPGIKEKLNLSDEQVNNLDLYSKTEEPLIEVIKTAILYMEDDQSVDRVSRKINQLFKKVFA